MKKPILIILSVFAVLILATVVEGFIPEALPSKPKAQVTIEEPKLVTSEEVETVLNEWRVDQGLPTFRTDNPILDQAAQARADSMCAANDWTHDKAWQVLDQYYQYSFASENLHYDFLQKDQAANAIYGWEHSPGHLKTMLADHKEASIGVKYCPGYQDMPTAVLIVNYFGNPR